MSYWGDTTNREMRQAMQSDALRELFAQGCKKVEGAPAFAQLNELAPHKKGAKFRDNNGAEWSVTVCEPQYSNSGKSISRWLIAFVRTTDKAIVANFGAAWHEGAGA